MKAINKRAENIRLISELISLELSFDESKHPRDHGKFTFKNSGGKDNKATTKKPKGRVKKYFEELRKKQEIEEQKEREYRKTSKGKQAKKVRIASAAALNSAGVAGYGYLVKKRMNYPIFKVKHRHIAGAAALAGASAAGL